MAISYPLSFPSHTGVQSIEIRARNAVAISRSPFTYDQQVHAYSGQCWEADVSLPPMKASDAEQWIAFLMSLRGQFGTFTMGDTLNTSLRGTASSVTVTAAAGDSSLDVDVPSGETVKAGDWIQLGSGSAATLHKVLQDYTGTGSLEADSLEVWPAVRVAHSATSAVISNTVGVWRLNVNETVWNINEAAIYGLTFGCIEAI